MWRALAVGAASRSYQRVSPRACVRRIPRSDRAPLGVNLSLPTAPVPEWELASRSPLTYASAAMLDRIKVTPGVCEGRPTIITVDFVLKLLGDGYTADDIVREYPELGKEDIYQAAKYGAWLASERTSAVA